VRRVGSSPIRRTQHYMLKKQRGYFKIYFEIAFFMSAKIRKGYSVNVSKK